MEKDRCLCCGILYSYEVNGGVCTLCQYGYHISRCDVAKAKADGAMFVLTSRPESYERWFVGSDGERLDRKG